MTEVKAKADAEAKEGTKAKVDEKIGEREEFKEKVKEKIIERISGTADEKARKNEKSNGISNREVKSDVFTAVFSEPENAAKLYTALSGVETAPEDIEITTLEGVLFLARKNDLGFTVRNRMLVISEHQSTVNPNMPLRSILYYGRTMEKLLHNQDLYREKLIRIPTPEFYLFYNGARSVPAEKNFRLSDAYLAKTDAPMLELTVKMININLPVGHRILRECMPLYEYSWFMEKIRTYLEEGRNRDTAITLAIQDCIREEIFADFVRKHGSEVENMLFTQFNMDDALAVRYEEGVEDGKAEGRAEGKAEAIMDLLREFGPIPGELQEEICGITDLQVLRGLLKLAAKAGSLEEFERAWREKT